MRPESFCIKSCTESSLASIKSLLDDGWSIAALKARIPPIV